MKTHTGQEIPEETLKATLKQVANEMRESARIGRKSDHYASHVTEKDKDDYLQKKLELADEVETGNVRGFWLWQRVNTIITGECVAFFPN